MNNNQGARPLIESAIMAAIMAVMSLIAVTVPIVSLFAALLWALPLVVAVVRHGLRWGMLAAVVAAFLMATLLGPAPAAQFSIAFAPTGLALGCGLRQRAWSGTRVVLVTLAVSIVAKLAALGLVAMLTGVAPFSGQLEVMEGSFGQAESLYEALGMSKLQIEANRENFKLVMRFLRLMLPLVVLLMGVVDTMLNYAVAGQVLKRLGLGDAPGLLPFLRWRFPSVCLLLFGLSLLALAYWQDAQDALGYQVALNVNMAMTIVGLVEGLSLLEFLAQRYRLNGFLRVLVIVLTFVNGLCFQIVTFAGLLDTTFDYRHRYFGDPRT